jgi:hypothetical protein
MYVNFVNLFKFFIFRIKRFTKHVLATIIFHVNIRFSEFLKFNYDCLKVKLQFNIC